MVNVGLDSFYLSDEKESPTNSVKKRLCGTGEYTVSQKKLYPFVSLHNSRKINQILMKISVDIVEKISI